MAWSEPHGKGHRGCYRDPQNRILKTAVYPSKRKAKQAAEDEEVKVRNGTWFDVRRGAITLAEYFDRQWYPNRGGERNTRANYRSHWNAKKHGIKVTFGHRELRHIVNSDVQGWVAQMIQDNLSPATIEGRYITLQTILAATKGASALRDGLIQVNPCHGIQTPPRYRKPVEIYTPDEVAALAAELGSWWAPVPMLVAETGLRWGEVLGLQVEDFTLGHRTLAVHRVIEQIAVADTGNGTPFRVKEYPKEGGRRLKRVALDEDARAIVADVIGSRDLKPGDRLFSAPDKNPGVARKATRGPQPKALPMEEWEPLRTDVWPGGVPIDRNTFRENVWKPAIKRAGVPERKFHALRASHISWLLAGGADLAWVRERVGHSNITTTQQYIAVMDDADDRGLDALSAVKGRYR